MRMTVTFDMDGEVFDRLHSRAMGNARSTEEEIQAILTQAVEPSSRDLPAVDAPRAWPNFLQAGVELAPTKDVAPRALELSLLLNHPAYDCF